MHVIIRYADGSKFGGDWYDAPAFEVQTISYVDPNGMAILRHQGDWYELQNGEIIAIAYHALVVRAYANGFKPKRQPDKELSEWATDQGYKMGSMVGSEKWKKIYSMGTADRDSLR